MVDRIRASLFHDVEGTTAASVSVISSAAEGE